MIPSEDSQDFKLGSEPVMNNLSYIFIRLEGAILQFRRFTKGVHVRRKHAHS